MRQLRQRPQRLAAAAGRQQRQRIIARQFAVARISFQRGLRHFNGAFGAPGLAQHVGEFLRRFDVFRGTLRIRAAQNVICASASSRSIARRAALSTFGLPSFFVAFADFVFSSSSRDFGDVGSFSTLISGLIFGGLETTESSALAGGASRGAARERQPGGDGEDDPACHGFHAFNELSKAGATRSTIG